MNRFPLGRPSAVGLGVLLLTIGTATGWYFGSHAHTEAQRAAAAKPPAPSVITARVTGGRLREVLEAVNDDR